MGAPVRRPVVCMSVELHSYRHQAMNTWFEIKLHTDDRQLARAVATEAFREIDRLETLLSRFQEGSDVDILNKRAGREPVRVTEECWNCLLQAMDLEILTGGVFSVAFEAFMLADSEKRPVQVGAWLEMDPGNLTVFFKRPDIRIDLGGIGKGYALDLVVKLIKDWDIEDFLLHAGTSSVVACGNGPEKDGWMVSAGSYDIQLINESLSGSSLEVQGSHILNIKSQQVLETKRRTWAWAPSGAISDALSTSFMLLGPEDIQKICESFGGLGALVLESDSGVSLKFGVAGERLA